MSFFWSMWVHTKRLSGRPGRHCHMADRHIRSVNLSTRLHRYFDDIATDIDKAD